MVWKKALVVAVAVAVRMVLLSMGLQSHVENSLMVDNPVSRMSRLQEALYLAKHNGDPYAGSIFHQIPLVLSVFSLVEDDWCRRVLMTALEVLTALMFAKCAAIIRNGDEKANTKAGVPSSSTAFEAVVMALYLLNPYTIATSLSLSLSTLTHFSIVASLTFVLKGWALSASIMLALSASLSLYPITVWPVCVIHLYRQHQVSPLKTMFFLITASTSFLSVSYVMGGESVFREVYWFLLTIPDLTPNVGVSWYLVSEVFAVYSVFFRGFYQLHIFLYMVPITFRFWSQPIKAFCLLTGCYCFLQPYTSLGDCAFYACLFFLHQDIVVNMTMSYLIFGAQFYTVMMLPIVWDQYVHAASGNSNFVYSTTVVYNVSQCLLVTEFALGMMRSEAIQPTTMKIQEKKWAAKAKSP